MLLHQGWGPVRRRKQSDLYASKIQELSAEFWAGLGLQQPPLVVAKLRTVTLLRVCVKHSSCARRIVYFQEVGHEMS